MKWSPLYSNPISLLMMYTRKKKTGSNNEHNSQIETTTTQPPSKHHHYYPHIYRQVFLHYLFVSGRISCIYLIIFEIYLSTHIRLTHNVVHRWVCLLLQNITFFTYITLVSSSLSSVKQSTRFTVMWGESCRVHSQVWIREKLLSNYA